MTEGISLTGVIDIPTLVIVGMHRSGTSCLAGSLQENNVYLGDVHLKNPFNLKGNRENQEIVDLNDAVLAMNGSKWDSPPLSPVRWNHEHEVIRNDILSRLNYSAVEGDCGYWGFKDPRTLLVLPFWQQAIKKIHYIGTFRHPLSVALSLKKRNASTNIDEAIDLWEQYNALLLELWTQEKFPLVCFDVPGEIYTSNLKSIFSKYGLNTRNIFYNEELRKNNQNMLKHRLPDTANKLYQKLFQIYNEQDW